MPEEAKTALVLGGGGSRGAYEIGVWQALREMDIHIDIITGTSVGAINGAMIAQNAFDLSVTLWQELQTDMVFDVGVLKKGDGPLKSLLNQYIDETTVRNNRVDYGLVTLELPALTPRYLFKEDIPKGKLVDFILASASLFPALKFQDIDNIKYVDGGYYDNLPVEMALKKGAVHVVAVDLETAGAVRKEPLKEADHLVLIRSKWDLGNILVFDGANSTRIIRLGYLDTLKAFGFYDGGYYCFPKGEFNKRSLDTAEMAAKVFNLNPAHLYTKSVFDLRLKAAVATYRKETEQELMDFSSRIKSRRLKKEKLPNILKKINEQTLTIIIADFLKNYTAAKNNLLTKSMLALFKNETKAAGYLVKEGLI